VGTVAVNYGACGIANVDVTGVANRCPTEYRHGRGAVLRHLHRRQEVARHLPVLPSDDSVGLRRRAVRLALENIDGPRPPAGFSDNRALTIRPFWRAVGLYGCRDLDVLLDLTAHALATGRRNDRRFSRFAAQVAKEGVPIPE
jgi:hypothetical protein